MKIPIPDAATEAAAKMIAGIEQTDWERWEDIAEHALRAAAPYMLAEAFDQGQKSGMRHADRLVAAAKIGRPELPGPISTNPYRPTK